MAEDWNAIAAEVADALRSVGQTDGGYPVALRRGSGGAPSTPGGPPTGDTAVAPLWGIVSTEEVRDSSGTLVDSSKRTVTVHALGIRPLPGDQVALGVEADEADDNSDWVEVLDVRPLAPAGIAVSYELDLAD